MIRRPPRSTRTDTLFPYTTLFRSSVSPTAGLISENFADVENITTGFFAQGYYELTDTIRATGGIRYTWDRRNTVLHNVRAYGLPGTATVGGLDNCVNADNDAPGVCAQTQKAKFDYPARSEDRRVGKECVRTVSSRWAPYPSKKNNKI